MKKYDSSREFQFWAYTASHGMLLVRSPGAADKPTVDLVFHGVQFVSLPRHVGSLLIVESEWDENNSNFIKVPRTSKRDFLFTLTSSGYSYYVVAAGMKITEHDNDIFWSPF